MKIYDVYLHGCLSEGTTTFHGLNMGGSKLVQAKKLKLLKMFHRTLAGLNGPWSEIGD